eukprot:TRINITY_DN87396_c0_g1_i1.p1 TRINITY_DN87396_c0_g1~~TRINITY_DN87396_c0_g1_i1.p1  ORF type:complete len:354 (+),score=55.32 TRINITY_DN87396_c0_g1_i1:36-1097(+)
MKPQACNFIAACVVISCGAAVKINSTDASETHREFGNSRLVHDGKLMRPDPGPMNPHVAGWAPVQKSPTDPKVIVTLSTTPEGAYSLNQIFDCLIKQSYLPDEIHVNMPKVSARGLGVYPDVFSFAWSWDLYRKHGIKVFRTRDWGALTNLIPTRQRVEREKERTLLIVIDDDKILPTSLVADHIRAFRSDPSSASTCRGYKVKPSMAVRGAADQSTVNELEIDEEGIKLGTRKRVGVVTGSDTWSVLASKFDSSLWQELDKKAPHGGLRMGKLASLMNDIWASGMLSRRNVPKFAIPCSYEVWDIRTSHAIHKSTVGEVTAGLPAMFAKRDAKNAEVMNYFMKDWKVEELII